MNEPYRNGKEKPSLMTRFLMRLTRIRRERVAGRTLGELIFGIILISIPMALLGTLFLPGRWFYLGGIIVGTVTAVLLTINMYDSIDAAVSMNEKRAKAYASWHGVLRILITAVILGIAIWIDVYAVVGVALGVVTLKLSGLLHLPIAKFFARLLGEETSSVQDDPNAMLPQGAAEEEDSLPFKIK